MSGNVERFSGFAQDYHAFRPVPPSALKEILVALSRTPRPKLVVDLGSGTGLSTRFWAGSAEKVIGIEPNADMRGQAVTATVEPSVDYQDGTSSRTGLQDKTADIVTCSQSLHWMEPTSTFHEVARILRIGGVFAAYDYDLPPTTGMWQADQSYMDCMNKMKGLEQEVAEGNQVHQWSKQDHLARMKESGVFRFTREIVIHHVDSGNGDRLVGLFLSQGGVRSLLKAGHTEREFGIDRFREKCSAFLATGKRTWYWSSRVRIGIT